MDIKRTWFLIRMHGGKIKKAVNLLAEAILLLTALLSLFLLVYEFGVGFAETWQPRIIHYQNYLLLTFFMGITLRYLSGFKEFIQEKMLFIDLALYFLLTGSLSATVFFPEAFNRSLPYLSFLSENITIHGLLLILSVIHISRQIFLLIQAHIKPSLLFLISFSAFILIGWGLLLLPNATTNGISVIDALFISSSSVCITGLTTVDVATTFTRTGHTIIMILIQIGGIGVMTFTSFIALSFMRHSSFSSKLMLKDLLNEDRTGGLFRVILNILIVTLFFEAIGTYAIYMEIRGKLGGDFSDDLFFAVFHSIAAFCSAGISTISNGYENPLLTNRYNLHIWVSILIIFGGLGFPIVFNFLKSWRYYLVNKVKVWIGLEKQYLHLPRIINLHSYVVIISTVVLIVIGFISFFLLEYNHTLADMPLGGKLAESFLGSVTPRTAGVSSIETSLLTLPTLVMTLFLMIIGAGPMSTGGGLKVTTVFVAILTTVSLLQGKENVEVKMREIAPATIKRAMATIVLYFFILITLFSVLSCTENHLEPFPILFESVSALSTVGLSLGITPYLSVPGKVLLCVTMLIGRIGLLTFFATFANETKKKNYTYPEENILM